MIIADLLESLAGIALALFLAIGALFTRRVLIRRRGGTFDCSLRLTPGSARAAVHFGLHAEHPAAGTRASGNGNGNGNAAGTNNGIGAGAGAGHALEADSHSHSHSHSQQIHPRAARGARIPLTAQGVRAGRGWAYGIAQYENDRIDWFRIFSYAYRPAAVLTRRDLEVIGRRDAEEQEELAIFPGWTVVECKFGTGLVELAMSPDALTGFLSWIEGAPPGQNVSRVS